jgi:hypothetical protein
MQIVDLEAVSFSPRAVENWGRVAREAVHRLIRGGVITAGMEIPIEQGQVNGDGTLTIFVEIAGHRIEVVVPQGEWEWNN